MAARHRPDMPAEGEVRVALSPWVMAAWLRNEAPEVVGYAGVPERCPLAQYLNAKVGAPRGRNGWYVSPGAVRLGWYVARPGPAMQVPLPDTLVAFVQAVDALPDREGWGRRRSVPRDAALGVLEQILADGRR